MKYFRFFCITLLLLLLTSCQNLFSGNESDSASSKSDKNYVSFTGNICLEGAYPQEFVPNIDSNNSTIRTAFPALPDGAVYRVTAEKNGTLIYDSSQNNTDIQIAADKSSFTIKQLATGTIWNITVAIYESSDTDFSAPLMSDSYPFTPSEENNVLTHDFELKPVLTGGKGSVSLILTYPAGAFDGFSFTCLSSNSDKWTCLIDNTLNNCVILSNTNGDNEIETGSYVIQFDFKKADIVLYSDIQTINIFKNMQTKHWVNNGGSEAIQTDGTYVVTQAMIDDFALTQIYVGTNSWGTASSNGTGSRFAPFDTLQKAIDYIGVAGKSTKNYTIWVSGGVNGGAIQGLTSIPETVGGKSSSITIRGMNLDSDGNPLDSLKGYYSKWNKKDFYGIALSSEEYAPVLTIVSTNDYTLKVTLQDICICEGAAEYAGGLLVGGRHVTVTLNNAVISNNHVKDHAGGIQVEDAATVYFNSGKITENSAYKSGALPTQKGSGYGGGVALINTGNFVMNGGEISSNSAYEYGGGVSLTGSGASTNSFTLNSGKINNNCSYGNKTTTYYGNACAAYIQHGTFTMNGGEIGNNHNNNLTSDSTAAILITGTSDEYAKFIMSGGIIYENYNLLKTTQLGSSRIIAIHLNQYGTIQLSGNAYIQKSSDNNHVIKLDSGKKISIAGTLSPTSDGTANGTAQSVAAIIDIADTYTENRKILAGNSQTNVNSASVKVRMKNDGWCVYQGKLIQGVITSTTELKDILTNMSANTASAPYNVIISDTSPDFDVLKEALYYGDKYVNLAFSNATFTQMSYLGTYTYHNEEQNMNYIHALKIVNITIPASVTSGSFASSSGLYNLQNYYVETGNTAYKSLDGILYTANNKTLVAFPKGKDLEGTEDTEGNKTYTIPSTVEIIGPYAFSRNSNLNTINIPGSVKEIKTGAFYECTNLTSVTLNEGLQSIADSSFTEAHITTINVPKSVTYICEQAFGLMAYTTLSEITVSADNEGGYYAYDGALYKTDENGYISLIYCPPKKTTWKIKDNITTKGGNAFFYNSSYNSTLTKIIFEEGVTSIKINFRGLEKVTDIYLPSTVTEIGSDLFYTSVKDVYYAETEDNRNSNTQLKNFLNVLGITWHYSTSYTGD